MQYRKKSAGIEEAETPGKQRRRTEDGQKDRRTICGRTAGNIPRLYHIMLYYERQTDTENGTPTPSFQSEAEFQKTGGG